MAVASPRRTVGVDGQGDQLLGAGVAADVGDRRGTGCRRTPHPGPSTGRPPEVLDVLGGAVGQQHPGARHEAVAGRGPRRRVARCVRPGRWSVRVGRPSGSACPLGSGPEGCPPCGPASGDVGRAAGVGYVVGRPAGVVGGVDRVDDAVALADRLDRGRPVAERTGSPRTSTARRRRSCPRRAYQTPLATSATSPTTGTRPTTSSAACPRSDQDMPNRCPSSSTKLTGLPPANAYRLPVNGSSRQVHVGQRAAVDVPGEEPVQARVVVAEAHVVRAGAGVPAGGVEPERVVRLRVRVGRRPACPRR